MSKMLTMEQIRKLEKRFKNHGDLDSDNWFEVLDNLEAALKVVEAAKKLTESRWSGGYQEAKDLMNALAPFREEKEKPCDR